LRLALQGRLSQGGAPAHFSLAKTRTFPVAIILTDEGIRDIASRLPVPLAGVYVCGLWTNDVEPAHGSTLAFLGPVYFSGYAGERLVSSWLAPVWDGTRATIDGPVMIWTRGSGVQNGRVQGYYLATLAGVCVGAERIDPATWMSVEGQTYRVQPRLSWRSEF
jgi:hypothetical protein